MLRSSWTILAIVSLLVWGITTAGQEATPQPPADGAAKPGQAPAAPSAVQPAPPPGEAKAGAQPEAKPAAETAAQIKRLIEQLSDMQADVRDQSQKELTQLGSAAIAAVVEAADSANLERSTRCVEILADLKKSGEAATRAAAEEGLKTLAQSKNRTVARRAQVAVEPVPDPFNGGFAPAGVFAVRVAGGNRVSVRNIAGQIEIQATEGNGQMVEISKAPAGEIRVRVKSPAENGKPAETKEYTAKSAAELEKIAPEGFKIYAKYEGLATARRVAVPQFGQFPGQLPPGAAPQFVPQARRFVVVDQQLIQDLAAAETQVKAGIDKLTQLSQQAGVKPEELQAVAKTLSEAHEKVQAIREKLPQ